MNSPLLSASSTSRMDADIPKEEETALRLLNFGQESVDMLHSISSVFSETVDRAEVWIDRLRLRPPETHLEDQPIQLPSIHTLDQALQHPYAPPDIQLGHIQPHPHHHHQQLHHHQPSMDIIE